MKEETIDTHSKALRINLDPRWYGTFAEIGAGQEVVRWFFRVGGAAGTIAKSISAYDMKVSDAIYGHAERYVSRGRLQAMLDHEFDLDVERLGKERGDNTSFFAFADTVVARSYRGGHEFHGWMGIKFQSRVHDQPSQIVMHLRMLDAEASLQQEALGIVGVNLCYGAFFLSHMPEQLIESLLDKLTTGRVEIDLLDFTLAANVVRLPLGAFMIGRSIRSVLFEVAPTDPTTVLGVAVLLLVTSALACYIPARRAARIDPIVALRVQ